MAFLLFLTGKAAVNEIQLVSHTVSTQDSWRLPLWLQGSSVQQTLVASLPPPSKIFLAITGSQGQLVLPAVLGFTQNIGDVVSGVLVILFLSIYWSINQIHFERLWALASFIHAPKTSARYLEVVEPELGTYIRSEIIQKLARRMTAGNWLLAAGSPYPALLAITGAIFFGWFPSWGLPLD